MKGRQWIVKFAFAGGGLLACSLLAVGVSTFLAGCGVGGHDCPNPNTLSGYVYLQRDALSELDGTLEDDVLVSERATPPDGFVPFKGAKVTVEETGDFVTLGEQGKFVFYPLPAGTYTLVIQYGNFPSVRHRKSVCTVTVSSYYYRPPFYDDPPRPLDLPSPPTAETIPPSGGWDDGGLSSWGEGSDASARKR